jgi:hypothetical protein
MKSKGQLQWKGSKMEWPHGPVQWVLTVIGAIDSVVCVVLFVRTHDFGQQMVINLVFSGSVLVLWLLYRLSGHRAS